MSSTTLPTSSRRNRIGARIATTVATIVATLAAAGVVSGMWAPTAGAVPPPTTTMAPESTELTVSQSWDQLAFSFLPVDATNGDEYTVTFGGRACAVRVGHRPTSETGCTIHNTGNTSGAAVLARNRTGVGTTIIDRIDVASLASGDCGALRPCPDFQITQFPDALQFVWNGSSGSSRTGTTITLGGATCTVRHNKAPEAPFVCTITGTNDAAGVAIVSSWGPATRHIVTGLEITALGEGKCGDLPRCIDAPINFTATGNKNQSATLQWQSHDGTEFSGSGYQVLMSANNGPKAPVCTHLLRTIYDNKKPAESECIVPGLNIQVTYTFEVAHYGRGRAAGIPAIASTSISFADHQFEHAWRAEPNGQLVLRFEWNSDSANQYGQSGYMVSSDAGGCSTQSGSGRLSCEVRVSKATADALPATFDAWLDIVVPGKAKSIDRLTATPPPARPSDPINLSVSAAKTTATISWDHPARSTAVRYGVWLSGPGLPTCEVRDPRNGRESCRLDGLAPGTDYTVHVYAEDAIGQRSESPRQTFSTEAAGPGPCDEGGRYQRVRDNKVSKAHTQYAKKVERAVDRLEDRPKKLARKVRKLAKNRDTKIAKAEALYGRRCA